ncbi:MAG: phosphatase PAP2 family protein [Pseudonocardiales bacterium]|nr:phosphatase PAP2 family protein [Actinomycetota bacterium]
MTGTPFQTGPTTNRRSGVAPVTRCTLVLLAAAIGLFVVAASLGFILIGRRGGGPIQGWDDAVWRWAIHHRGPFVGAAKVVAAVGDAPVLGAICGAATIALLVRLRSLLALVPLVAYLGAEFQVFAVRQVIHRHRPPTAVFPARDAVRGVHETTYSFPSGHAVAVTAVLFAALGMLGLARRRAWPWFLAFVASLCVAASRILLGVHWLSDVAVGLLIGIVWGTTVALAAQRVPRRQLPG